MTQNEEGFIGGGISGAASGALIGSMVAPGVGTVVGATVGFAVGGLWGNLSGDRQRRAQKKAMQEAEQARIRSVMQEFGRRQQADQTMLAQTQRSSSKTQQPGVVMSDMFGAPKSGGNAGTF